MNPAARLQAAIELLDEVIASARDDGPPADALVTRYFKHRRYAGSKDRRAVRELVFRAIRRSGDRPNSGRAAIVGMAEGAASWWLDERRPLDAGELADELAGLAWKGFARFPSGVPEPDVAVDPV